MRVKLVDDGFPFICFQKREYSYAANIVNLCALYTFTGLDWINVTEASIYRNKLPFDIL